MTTSPRTACAGILFALLLLAAGGCGSAHQTEQATDTLHLTTMRIRGFDPAHSVDEASVRAAGLVYEGLLQYSYWTRPYRVEPLLAATMPELSADGKTWRFLLRSGIYFADDPCFVASGGKGRELMAADVAYSIRRIADTKVGSS
ncbi:MAG TPA: ABC transporter substrate-binding protein, partial [Kiritimatiellia bacterium]|nr:ABC transporter substrate-binding protein [Kiritimatiellia bacterium]